MQSRDGDLNEFFSHETQSYPPSLSDFGKLQLLGTKSQLIPCILPDEQPEQLYIFDCKILDGAYLFTQLQDTGRLDIIGYTFVEESLKDQREERKRSPDKSF